MHSQVGSPKYSKKDHVNTVLRKRIPFVTMRALIIRIKLVEKPPLHQLSSSASLLIEHVIPVKYKSSRLAIFHEVPKSSRPTSMR